MDISTQQNVSNLDVTNDVETQTLMTQRKENYLF